MSACNGTPISWLRLERYFAGDLDDAQRAAIAEHLASCATCRAAADEITGDKRALPPLPASRRRPLARVFTIATGLALAAGVVFAATRLPRPEEMGARVKGDGVAFTLVRNDESVVADASGTYNDGDRWKVLVTCPASMRTTFDVAVYENGDASFPLEPTIDLPCGNNVSLPGAFRVTGRARLTVCLVWGDTVDRSDLRGSPPALSLCKILDPAP